MRLQDKRPACGDTKKAKWLAINGILFPRDDPSTYPGPWRTQSYARHKSLSQFEATRKDIEEDFLQQLE
ncbi:hypothetical protein GGR58DRAFT_28060 [Xylaria digitata]|nr:hypothetical protein GGR58DRAFT_28060 [Xylaria digitata]